MEQKITVGEALKSGWDKAFSRFGLILGTLVLAQILVGSPSFARSIFQSVSASTENAGLAVFFVIISLGLLVLQYWLQVLTGIGLIRIQLNTVDGKAAEFGQLFQAEGVFWQYLGTAILYGLIVAGGLILLIVPGIYWALKYQFALNLIVDKKLAPVEALRASGQITYNHKWWLLGFAIVLGLINIATIFTLFLGLVITVPVTVMAHMYVYRKLSNKLSKSKK